MTKPRPRRPTDLGRARRKRERRRVGLIAGLFASGLVASYVIAAALLHVSTIRVVGARTVSADVVLKASGLHGGERILATRLGRAASRVGRLAAIKHVRVRRSLPTGVVIEVTERRPQARLDTKPELAADASGVLFGVRPQVVLPVLQGWKAKTRPGARIDATTRAMLAAYALFPKGIKDRTAQIVWQPPRLTLVLVDGSQVWMGAPELLAAKAASALAVIEDAGHKGERLEYVDVRAPRTPVAKAYGQTPSPSPAALASDKPKAKTPAPSRAATPVRHAPAPTPAKR